MDIIKELNEIKENTKSGILKFIIEDILDLENEGEMIDHIKDVIAGGCESGAVTSLITRKDTHDFFHNHYDEIEEIREEWEENTGATLKIEGDLKNFLSWLAYEYTIQILADNLKIDY